MLVCACVLCVFMYSFTFYFVFFSLLIWVWDFHVCVCFPLSYSLHPFHHALSLSFAFSFLDSVFKSNVSGLWVRECVCACMFWTYIHECVTNIWHICENGKWRDLYKWRWARPLRGHSETKKINEWINKNRRRIRNASKCTAMASFYTSHIQ